MENTIWLKLEKNLFLGINGFPLAVNGAACKFRFRAK